jgi:hypothetical protein
MHSIRNRENRVGCVQGSQNSRSRRVAEAPALHRRPHFDRGSPRTRPPAATGAKHTCVLPRFLFLCVHLRSAASAVASLVAAGSVCLSDLLEQFFHLACIELCVRRRTPSGLRHCDRWEKGGGTTHTDGLQQRGTAQARKPSPPRKDRWKSRQAEQRQRQRQRARRRERQARAQSQPSCAHVACGFPSSSEQGSHCGTEPSRAAEQSRRPR